MHVALDEDWASALVVFASWQNPAQQWVHWCVEQCRGVEAQVECTAKIAGVVEKAKAHAKQSREKYDAELSLNVQQIKNLEDQVRCHAFFGAFACGFCCRVSIDKLAVNTFFL